MEQVESDGNPTNFLIRCGDSQNAPLIKQKISLLWTDIPFGTGSTQSQGNHRFKDPQDISYVLKILRKWVQFMAEDGTIVICCDYRAIRKILNLFEELNWTFMGEVIWTFGLGRPRTKWWPVRHNNLLTFTRQPFSGYWDNSNLPTEKRLAPKPGYSDTKPAGSVWEYTMSNTSPERVGYPNQKPISIISPFIQAHTSPGQWVADPFMGSGSTGEASKLLGRSFLGMDINPEAVRLAKWRLGIETELEIRKKI